MVDKSPKCSKLRNYVRFKVEFETEKCLFSNITKLERSHIAQSISEILLLRVETGRYIGLQLYERLCQICYQNSVEDEIRFLFCCQAYVSSDS